MRAGLSRCEQPAAIQADVQLAGVSGTPVYQQTTGLTPAPLQCDAAAYIQIPLYSAPNVPIPSGDYRLTVTVTGPEGEAGTASVPLTLK